MFTRGYDEVGFQTSQKKHQLLPAESKTCRLSHLKPADLNPQLDALGNHPKRKQRLQQYL